MSNKVKFYLEQKEKLVNKAALESCERETCKYEACKAHENGISIAHSADSRSIDIFRHGNGSEIYILDRTALMFRKIGMLIIYPNRTKDTDFHNNKHRNEAFRSKKVSDTIKISNRNDKKF
ncbi:hypothetical protein C1645_841524 [Glomus cerebriforme]|uniref:Uncharacterized protein n=1 Tax=Glomus cerebriforme TaxID=658196 RepID=A0A397S0N1_9GLOM|nr:hypothetical protein C1645_841524 [Glomus cerebriforme]